VTPNDPQYHPPTYLAWRSARLNDAPIIPERPYVLCWLHHAIRDHENPALDVAIGLGNSIDRPVLVYQGLGGNHRFNCDRHHVFIMEGARDLAIGLRRRGIASLFHLPAQTAASGGVRHLLDHACAMVTEDFPAPPFPSWTSRHAARATSMVLAVDAACLMPVRHLNRRLTRAFQFREAASAFWDQVIDVPWCDIEPTVEKMDINVQNLSFEPCDLEHADLEALAAGCEIDHTIPPVGRIAGGMSAGYARWSTFRDDGLRQYAAKRNDAANMDAVSGLSPYLHHGHISPFRIAREANAIGGRGSEKFLDELLVWREMSYHFCANTSPDDLETLRALPSWARDTLEDHRADPRTRELTWDDLHRARSGSPLWDAAQRSLLCNGELHNNVRMTWGKAIPRWTPTPEDALRALIDLNHRFALDGNNPNSYGGLLWCLGQFDRPFEPPQPILGTIRGRSTGEHAKRLDIETYIQAVEERRGYDPMRIAIVGGGIAGLLCARVLHDQGMDVIVFDRGRHLGGRLATREIVLTDQQPIRIDHGVPAFNGHDARVRRYLDAWRQAGIVDEWSPEVAEYRDGTLTRAATSTSTLIAVPTMRAIAEHLSRDLTVQRSQHVTSLTFDDDGVSLDMRHAGDKLTSSAGSFDAVALCMPAEQAFRLTSDHESPLNDTLRSMAHSAVWVICAVVEVATSSASIPTMLHCPTHPIIDVIVRDDRKPGRISHDGMMVLTVRTGSVWSTAHREDNRDAVGETVRHALLEVLQAFMGAEFDGSACRVVHAHRWAFARSTTGSALPCLVDADRRIVIAGDGFGTIDSAHGVERAMLSAQAAAGRLLAMRTKRSAGMRSPSAGPLFDDII